MTIVTPMMRQYQAIKDQYQDCLLFFRLGDFYELFADDALVASKELNIVLTAREGGENTKVPMCGVPYHAADNYIARLINSGFKVAICEQLEDPKQTKGIVKRDVVRVVTPGTVLEEQMLPEHSHNYLAACWRGRVRGVETGFGLSYVDISTGEFCVTEIVGPDARERLIDEISRLRPAELLLQKDLLDEDFVRLRITGNGLAGLVSQCFDESYINASAEALLKIHFKLSALEALGIQDQPLAVKAVAMILDFLQHTQKRSLSHIDKLKIYSTREFMGLDSVTRQNLELTATIRTNKKVGSLLWLLDETKTSMGSRLLKEWIESPLLSKHAINDRLDAITELISALYIKDEIRRILEKFVDIQRLVSRISYGSASPRELVSLAGTLRELPALYSLLSQLQAPLFMLLFDQFNLLTDIADLISAGIAETPPLSAKEHGVIRPGFNAEVDKLRTTMISAKDLLLQLEAKEREKTGIKSLKIGFNKVFGYYIEISKGKVDEAPDYYIRKQTLVNGERFITEELKELENEILGAGERLSELEYSLFTEIREEVAKATNRIQRTADIIANIDVLQSLATVAIQNNYCRPVVNNGSQIMIKEGRHPVVERIIGEENYIPNDTYLDHANQRMIILTGPNMAGKSTYMRQVALVVLLARMGSFVPAAEAVIGKCDRIFTRVGASDDLSTGQSTFMVEMNETSNILRNATSDSLVLLDEIGRGTSTFDGLSIAWAVAEYLINENCAAKTLFATHYHELTELENEFPLVKNYSIAVREQGSNITFLHKIIEGGADKSYGIHVAQYAGLPKSVISRAKNILAQLESKDPVKLKIEAAENSTLGNVTLNDHPLLFELQNLNLDSMTPLEAMLLLAQWKKDYEPENV